MNRNPTKVFTERGLYMLATVLKGEQGQDLYDVTARVLTGMRDV